MKISHLLGCSTGNHPNLFLCKVFKLTVITTNNRQKACDISHTDKLQTQMKYKVLIVGEQLQIW